jgi:hypothetical protein
MTDVPPVNDRLGVITVRYTTLNQIVNQFSPRLSASLGFSVASPGEALLVPYALLP